MKSIRFLVILFLIVGFVSTSQNCKNKSQSTEISGSFVWYRNRTEAFRTAERENRKIFLFFAADECKACEEFLLYPEKSPEVREIFQKYILLKVKTSDPEFENFKNDDRFPELKIKFPFFAIMNSSEELLFKSFDPAEIVRIAGGIK
ncbi:MAG: thioredoxin family protein [Leptospira sp.]|nr:thioredoxin family protein [Leptospira sp.]